MENSKAHLVLLAVLVFAASLGVPRAYAATGMESISDGFRSNMKGSPEGRLLAAPGAPSIEVLKKDIDCKRKETRKRCEPTAAPEPGALMLLLSGLALGVAGFGLRRHLRRGD